VIDAMPRPRPPHLQRQVTRHGKVVWYVRLGRGPKVGVRAEFGTPKFDAEYQAALAGTQHSQKKASHKLERWRGSSRATVRPARGATRWRLPRAGSARTFSNR
jgi:hypothetical protein